MNIIKQIKLLWSIKNLIALIKGGGMQSLKTWAGIIKVVGFACMLVSLLLHYLPVDKVLVITLAISQIDKIVTIIVNWTKTKVDDERYAEIQAELKKNGLLK
jgi:hypothetical protein